MDQQWWQQPTMVVWGALIPRFGSNFDLAINPYAREKWLPCFGKSWGDRFMAGWEIGFTWFDRRGGGGWTVYAAPLGLKISLGVWCYKYFAPLVLGMGRTSAR
jgi:hypothetical protein